jgi:hypothetical protein
VTVVEVELVVADTTVEPDKLIYHLVGKPAAAEITPQDC